MTRRGAKIFLFLRVSSCDFVDVFSKDRAFAALPVKAGDITKGDYILILFSHNPNSGIKEVERYFFRVS